MIRTAIMSLWSRPQGVTQEPQRRDALLWSLATLYNRRQFEKLRLVTDSEGARFLIDELALPFDSVSTALDQLTGVSFWSAGKLQACLLADEPFAHLDHDAFLRRPLPDHLLHAGAIAERPEPEMHHLYPMGEFWRLCACVPERWREARTLIYNTGLFGGNDLERLHRWAAESLEIERTNPRLQSNMGGTQRSLILEQFAYGVEFQYSVQTLLRAQPSQEEATLARYTHLCGGDKDQPRFRERAKQRLADASHEQYQRLERMNFLN